MIKFIILPSVLILTGCGTNMTPKQVSMIGVEFPIYKMIMPNPSVGDDLIPFKTSYKNDDEKKAKKK